MLRTFFVLYLLRMLHPMQLHAQAAAGIDQFICGDATSLQANVPGVGESGTWSVISGTAVFADDTDALTSVTGLSLGENILMWGYVNPLGASSDVVSIWSYDPAVPPANAGPDQTIVGPPFTATMNASGCQASPCICFWTVVAGTGVITYPNDPLATISQLPPGSTVLRWTCNNGPCGSTSDDVILSTFVWTGIHDSEAPAAGLRYNSSTMT